MTATAGSFRANVNRFAGSFRIPAENSGSASGSLRFDFADVDTGVRRRDAHMLRWLDHQKYPNGRFSMTRVMREAGITRVAGILEAAGKARPVEFPVELSRHDRDGDHAFLEVRGRWRLDYRDWGLDVIRLLFFLSVDPHFEVDFELRGPVGIEP